MPGPSVAQGYEPTTSQKKTEGWKLKRTHMISAILHPKRTLFPEGIRWGSLRPPRTARRAGERRAVLTATWQPLVGVGGRLAGWRKPLLLRGIGGGGVVPFQGCSLGLSVEGRIALRLQVECRTPHWLARSCGDGVQEQSSREAKSNLVLTVPKAA